MGPRSRRGGEKMERVWEGRGGIAVNLMGQGRGVAGVNIFPKNIMWEGCGCTVPIQSHL